MEFSTLPQQPQGVGVQDDQPTVSEAGDPGLRAELHVLGEIEIQCFHPASLESSHGETRDGHGLPGLCWPHHALGGA